MKKKSSKNIFLNIFNYIKNKFVSKRRYVNRILYKEEYNDEIDLNTLIDYYKKSYILKTFYNFLYNTFSSVKFYKKTKDDLLIYDHLLDTKLKESITSYYFFSGYYLKVYNNNIYLSSVLSNDIDDNYVLLSKDIKFTRRLLNTIEHFERIIEELFKNSKNATFLMLHDDVVLNNSGVFEMIENLKKNREVTELNNLSVLDVKLDKLEINTDFEKYNIDVLRTHIIKTTSQLLNINTELLNDNDTTFNNKLLAFIQFYNTTIISFIEMFINDINSILKFYDFDYNIDYEIDLYVLKEKELDEFTKLVNIYKNNEKKDEEIEQMINDYIKKNMKMYL